MSLKDTPEDDLAEASKTARTLVVVLEMACIGKEKTSHSRFFERDPFSVIHVQILLQYGFKFIETTIES